MRRFAAALASALVLSAGVGVAEAGIAENTTYQIARLALTKYRVDVSLSGGPSAGQCDSFKHSLPTKIVCSFPTNRFQALCITSINMRTVTHSSGEVVCGRISGPARKQWTWRAYYRWDGHTYTWYGRSGGVA